MNFISLSRRLLERPIQGKKLVDFFLSFKNRFQRMSWSDKEAELISHIEIMNQSALLTISDLKGNIIHANELFCKVSKYTIDELVNKPHSIIRHPDTASSVFKDMWSTIGKGNVWQSEIKNRAKDGSAYWVIATVAPVIGPNSKPIKYISVRYDITQQKKIEEELRQAKEKIDHELHENIAYAKHIHSSFLSNNQGLETCNDSFLLYKARKIISGDFYKIERNDNKLTVVIGDSTGHGVSASYISVLVLNILSRVMRFCDEDPGKLLKMINKELNRITHLNKEKQLIESADMIVCCIDKESGKIIYASARMTAFIIRDGEVILLEKDKCSIGETSKREFKITNRTLDLKKGDCLYIASDGIKDQIGGSLDKCIGLKKILAIITESQAYTMQEQKTIISEELLKWQGTNEQTDDITLFGIQI